MKKYIIIILLLVKISFADIASQVHKEWMKNYGSMDCFTLEYNMVITEPNSEKISYLPIDYVKSICCSKKYNQQYRYQVPGQEPRNKIFTFNGIVLKELWPQKEYGFIKEAIKRREFQTRLHDYYFTRILQQDPFQTTDFLHFLLEHPTSLGIKEIEGVLCIGFKSNHASNYKEAWFTEGKCLLIEFKEYRDNKLKMSSIVTEIGGSVAFPYAKKATSVWDDAVITFDVIQFVKDQIYTDQTFDPVFPVGYTVYDERKGRRYTVK